MRAWHDLIQPGSQPVVLLEVAFQDSTRYLATLPYISQPDATPANTAYDDVLVEGLLLQADINHTPAVADVTFYDTHPQQYGDGSGWGAYQAWIGDLNWHRDDFIALSRGQVAEQTQPARHQIRLLLADPALEWQRSIQRDTVLTGTLVDCCQQLAAWGGFALPQFIHFDSVAPAQLRLTVTPEHTYDQALRELAASVGAVPRFDALGQLALVYLDHAAPAAFSLGVDDILQQGLSQSSTQPASNVVLTWGEDQSIRIDNGALNDHNVTTPINHAPDAQREAERRARWRATPHSLWQVEALLPGLPLQPGQTHEPQLTKPSIYSR